MIQVRILADKAMANKATNSKWDTALVEEGERERAATKEVEEGAIDGSIKQISGNVINTVLQ